MFERPETTRTARTRLPVLLGLLAALAVLPSVTATVRAAAPADAVDLAACDSLVTRYLAAVVAGDTVTASACWRTVDVAGAARLGITYHDLPLKVDGDSPLWWARTGPLAAAPPFQRRGAVAAADGTVSVALVIGAGSDTTRFTYHLAREERAWRLASPVALAAAAAGPGLEGRYVRLHGLPADRNDGRHLAALAALDSCVAGMLDRLEADADLRARLEAGKLGYLLLPPPEVARLAGAPTVGVANLQQDVVVTSHPCHAHELAHLVVNAWLRQVPASMLPILQEGLAVQLGGRWGRHPRVLERLGRTTLDAGWVSLDDLLDRGGFSALPADLSYAPAGTFAGHVIDRYGADGLRRACLAASGSASAVARWDRAEVRRRLSTALSADWDVIAEDLALLTAAPAGSGLVAGAAGPLPEAAVRECADGLCFAVAEADASVSVVVTAGPGQATEGALLFGGGAEPAGPNALFAEHFPDQPWLGQTHGLLVSGDEARLYDYRLQMLVALHAEGFWPDPAWRDPLTGALALRVDKALWPAGQRTVRRR